VCAGVRFCVRVRGPRGGFQYFKRVAAGGPVARVWDTTHAKHVCEASAQWRARNKGNEVKKTHSRARHKIFKQTVPPFIRSLLGGVGCWSLFWFWLVSGLR
jgi:hypothetical protein